MELPNIHFQDFPIEFKEINPNDFNDKFIVPEKQIIETNDEGYISDALIPIIHQNYDEKNTVVINAGVGQGKSTAIIEMATNYANADEYVVIIAVPYKNLIEQYERECIEHISKSKIFNILNLEHIEFLENNGLNDSIFGVNDSDLIAKFKISDFKIHILTINSLLGNAGEDNLFQARKRDIYFNKLQTYCRENNKKIILVLDEIHDSVHNFKEEYLYKLWNYQGLIHKIFVVSATFNEASKEVIKYLAEFTDNKIQIIESERKIIPEKQSRLHLRFHSDYFVERDRQLVDLLEQLIDGNKEFDILTYSKKQTKNLFKIRKSNYLTTGHLLKDLKNEINICYSDIFDGDANKKYNPNKINIGTNFSTGISIKKEFHTLIVMLPKKLNIKYFNNKGIFNLGAIPIIQSLARQRTQGDIYIFLPKPLGINIKSLPYNTEKNTIIFETFEEFKTTNQDKYVDYTNINSQRKVLNQAYKKLLKNVKNATEFIQEKNRVSLNRLDYPPKEIFILEKGEKFLAKDYFAGDLSAYVLWASICNQFLNCRLDSISTSNKIYLSQDNLYSEISEIYKTELEFLNSFYTEFSFVKSLSKIELFEFFKSYLFEQQEIIINNKKVTKQQIAKIYLILLSLLIDENSIYLGLKYEKDSLLSYYVKSSLIHSNILIINDEVTSFLGESKVRVISLYKEWLPFIRIIQENSQFKKGMIRINSMPNQEFNDLFTQNTIAEKISELIDNDTLLNSDIFPFKDTYNRLQSESNKIKFFYLFLVKHIFNRKQKQFKVNRVSIREHVVDNFDIENQEFENLLYKNLPEITL